MPTERTILHVDMDAFFASVEQLDAPALRGKPVLVGGDGPRGVVAAASYEARAFGCRSAQPMAVAKRLCPGAVIVRGRFERYRERSRAVIGILESYTPLVEQVSIDEAFLDVTGCARLFGDGPSIARAIRLRISTEVGLTASVGVATNKFLAKLASDLEKPDGLTVVPAAETAAWLAPLPVERLWGVGPKSAERLRALGISTFGAVAAAEARVLERLFGTHAAVLRDLARGVDDRPVEPGHDRRSIGHEQTVGHDLPDPDAAERLLIDLAQRVARRLRRDGRLARTIVIKLRRGADFMTTTRRRALPEPTDSTAALEREARALFRAWAAAGYAPLRLVGVQVCDLVPRDDGASLLPRPDRERDERLDRTADRIVARFGETGLSRGIHGETAAKKRRT